LPKAWIKFVEKPENITILFQVVFNLIHNKNARNDKFKKVITYALKCLEEYANIRISSFTNLDLKKIFTNNFITNLIQLISAFMKNLYISNFNF
jgi:hypothetical protein